MQFRLRMVVRCHRSRLRASRLRASAAYWRAFADSIRSTAIRGGFGVTGGRPEIGESERVDFGVHWVGFGLHPIGSAESARLELRSVLDAAQRRRGSPSCRVWSA